MDPISSVAEIAKDYAKQAAWVFAMVELAKDFYPAMTAGVTKLASYAGGAIVVALYSYTPGMSWRDYLALVLFNGLAVGMMAIGLHQSVQRVQLAPPAGRQADAA